MVLYELHAKLQRWNEKYLPKSILESGNSFCGISLHNFLLIKFYYKYIT